MKQELSFSKRSSHSGLFLLEIILAILAFAVVSAICLQLFVKAHTLAQDTKDLDMAVREASSVASVLTQTETPMESLKALYPYAKIEESARSAILYYDAEYQPCAQEAAVYQLQILASLLDTQTTAYSLSMRKNNDTSKIYSLEVTAYRQYTP